MLLNIEFYADSDYRIYSEAKWIEYKTKPKKRGTLLNSSVLELNKNCFSQNRFKKVKNQHKSLGNIYIDCN